MGLAVTPSGSIDCIVTDPPYRTISGGVGGSDGRPTGMLLKNDGKVFKHNDIDISEYASELFRVLTSPGHCWVFTNELNRRPIEDEMLRVGFKCHGLFGWHKNNAVVNRCGMKNWEPFFLFRKGPARGLYTPGIKQMISVPNPVGSKLHPTEKPVDLMKQLVLASSQVGETVMDPFAGAGSVGVACNETGRRFVGFEIDPVYAMIGMGRLT